MDHVTHNRNMIQEPPTPYPGSENESDLNLIYYHSASGTMKLLLELGLNPLNRNYRSNLELWMIFFPRETQEYLELRNAFGREGPS